MYYPKQYTSSEQSDNWLKIVSTVGTKPIQFSVFGAGEVQE